MTPEQIEVLNLVVLVVFTGLLVIGASTTFVRKVALSYRHIPAPRLLPRDVALLSGLAWPFALILMARAFTWNVAGQPLWILATSIPPIIGVGIYVYYELFVIGQPEDWRIVVRVWLRRTFRGGG